MKRKKKIFDLMLIVGMCVFMFMMIAMLFVDFTKLELAIPLVIGIIGYFGSEYYKNQMKRRNRQRVHR
jgi:hypothetical protein